MFSLVVTISIDLGVLYFRPLVFPRPALICFPFEARRTSSYIPSFSSVSMTCLVFFILSKLSSNKTGNVILSSNLCPLLLTISLFAVAAKAEFIEIFFSLLFISPEE